MYYLKKYLYKLFIMWIKPFKYYWLSLLIPFILYFGYKQIIYLYTTKNIGREFINSKYVGNGVFVNQYNFLTSTDVQESCTDGRLYVLTKKGARLLKPVAKNNINKLALFSVIFIQDSISDYVLIRREEPVVGEKIVYKRQRNDTNFFSDVESKIISSNIFGYVYSDYAINNNENGMPVFSKNYTLIGMTIQENNTYSFYTMFEKLLIKLKIKKTYDFVPNTIITKFLTDNNIKYYMVNTNSNLKEYKDDVVFNIICSQK